MAFFKHTMLLQSATTPSTNNAVIRVGGWSESFYDTSPQAPSFNNLCQARAALLPTGSAIVGQRIQQTDPAGRAQVFNTVFPGTAGTQADVPQMALLMSARATNGQNTRALTLRGIPDARVVSGEYNPSVEFTRALETFTGRLIGGAWRFRGLVLDAAQFPILWIREVAGSTTGEADITAAAPIPGGITENTLIQVMQTVDDFGIKRGGRFKAESVSSDGVVRIKNWPYGNTDGGRVRAVQFSTFPIGEVGLPRVIVRKVGRPFASYRGRASKRRPKLRIA